MSKNEETVKEYLCLDHDKAPGDVVVTKLEDLAGDFRPEDDIKDFLVFLEAERARSLTSNAARIGSMRKPCESGQV